MGQAGGEWGNARTAAEFQRFAGAGATPHQAVLGPLAARRPM
jgi:hypothetical protein